MMLLCLNACWQRESVQKPVFKIYLLKLAFTDDFKAVRRTIICIQQKLIYRGFKICWLKKAKNYPEKEVKKRANSTFSVLYTVLPGQVSSHSASGCSQ